ncbi:MAG: sigma 54-interacting transcriptional regulator [Deltaproteobacteria bacterium]|nr:sigma 54-interacting transcriptional regulator [Deltaproteobacteria bacterium]
MAGESTLSWGTQGNTQARAACPQPCLFVVLVRDKPGACSSRHLLTGLDTVFVGRARAHGYSRQKIDGQHALSLGFPDRWISSQHARLVRSFDKWVLEDSGSRNGTLVNGARVQRMALADGDWIEVGHVFLLFRESVAWWEEDLPDLDSTRLAPPTRALATLIPSLDRLFCLLQQVAGSQVTVMIRGETGTGKELVAQAVHGLSKRSGSFIPVNCGALSDTLLQSELFGYRKGAFSGATTDRLGLVRSADGGTLFLDEIGDLPLDSQVAFLRVLQENQVTPVGASLPVSVNFRTCAATHRDLDDLVKAGQFRNDLLARLSGFSVHLPALRERKEDLGILIGSIVSRLVADGKAQPAISAEAARALLAYSWPLNIRELEKCLATALVIADQGRIGIEHLPDSVRGLPEPGSPATEGAVAPSSSSVPKDERRRQMLLVLLKEHKGNLSSISRMIGKAPAQIRRWLKRYGIDAEKFREPKKSIF